ncbi:MAG: hypothetical protein IKE28_04425 [Solobacterium sp.]|nr:hypothetical protein [Solobacterium sp.]
MFSFLEGMHQRVLLGYCADSILNRKNRNTEIEGWFAHNEIPDHLFYDVLLFVMEYSLSETGGCSLREISGFLSEDLRFYDIALDAESIERLASYMIKDILQNGGSVLSRPVFHHETKQWEEATIRLIEDHLSDENVLLYRLSQQGYDFLLRTKEIDNQFEGWVSMLITKQQLERRNYKESFDQARQSLQILRKQQTAFEEFIRSIRRDLKSVENDAYSKMIGIFYDNLEAEQEITRETIRILKEYRRDMSQQKDRLLEQEDASLEQSLEYLRKMSEILETIMDTENELLSNRINVRKIYESMLEASLVSDISFRRYDLFETILKPAVHMHDEELEAFTKLKRPLLVPKTDKILNLGLLYAPQRNLEEADLEAERILNEEEEENERLIAREKRMRLYREAFGNFMDYSRDHDRFTIKEFVTFCDREAEEQDKDFLSDSKLFFLMFLDLYAYGTIDFEKLINEPVGQDESAEEFDIRQMIQSLNIPLSEHNIQAITLSAKEGSDIYTLRNEADENISYGMDSLEVQVTRGEKQK